MDLQFSETLVFIILGFLFGGVGVAVLIKPSIFGKPRRNFFSRREIQPKKYGLLGERINGVILAVLGVLMVLRGFNIL